MRDHTSDKKSQRNSVGEWRCEIEILRASFADAVIGKGLAAAHSMVEEIFFLTRNGLFDCFSFSGALLGACWDGTDRTSAQDLIGVKFGGAKAQAGSKMPS